MERVEHVSSQKGALEAGFHMPQFALQNTNAACGGDLVKAPDFFASAKARLVLFTCNHCPYVKGSESELNKVILSLLSRGLQVLAINSNDPVAYPDDGIEQMVLKCRTFKLPYPYLFDETQEVAKAFKAQYTPECFLFDEKNCLVYHGALNDSPRNPDQVKRNYLQDACEQLLTGMPVFPSEIKAVGCSIKWNFQDLTKREK
jgi:peroxiredoxin